MNPEELKSFLNEKADYYNRPNFIESDPIQIPHGFDLREDIEISAFLTAIIAWGNRKSVISSARKMMTIMGDSPYDFVMSATDAQMQNLQSFVHRTFNGADLYAFVLSLRHLYQYHGGMEPVFAANLTEGSLQPAIHEFRKLFLLEQHPARVARHVSDPMKNSAAKRMNMFLRWMVRRDNRGVDFGLWTNLPMNSLSCPLDVHSGKVARKLGLLMRRQDDAKALSELDASLRKMNPDDPVKYDFALFGLGAFEGF